jgi:NADH:ubiquinone oxidoreductase subunit 6 (subunit J)
MVIYAFYMIFFLKDEAGITKAKQVLKWVAIAIIIMWLSRFIVSMIFWIQSNSANPENDTPPVNNASSLNPVQADMSNVSMTLENNN